jgi:iron complex outermembrane receptor protein
MVDGIFEPNPLGGNTLVSGADLSGNHLTRAPDLSGNFWTTYTHPLQRGQLVATLNYYHSSRVYFDSANFNSQPSFDITNASVTYQAPAHWDVSFWAKNLGNQPYLIGISPSQLGSFGLYAEPRTYGVSFGWAFGR